MRDCLSSQHEDTQASLAVSSLLDKWRSEPDAVEPYIEMQAILEELRSMPPGDARTIHMNSVLRTLGKPKNLSALLDALRDSVSREGSREQEISKNKLQNVRMHSIYGWCGNTLLIESLSHPTKGTYPCNERLGDRLGNSATAWNLTLHVWQPNAFAKPFPVSTKISDESYIEPPHSHPFDFVSMVVKGKLHQSLYSHDAGADEVMVPGYYDDIPLRHVDGVWPPHDFSREQKLRTREHRVPISAGESYYMPCDWIHDVEIDRTTASSAPAISLFMSSEYLVMPHVYISGTMQEYHKANPDIKKSAKPISPDAWHNKLNALSRYIRGDAQTLDLNEIVNFNGTYAFYNCAMR